MKQIILLISIIGISFNALAQYDNNRHEFRIDALEALVFPGLDISYEYILGNYSGAGVAVNVRLDSPNDDYEVFTLAPYYRQYFFDNAAYGIRGFYAEGLLQYTNGKDDRNNITLEVETYDDIGIGFGGGYKLIAPNGFVIDAGLDLGRNFKLDEASNDFFFRFGISIGYRFF